MTSFNFETITAAQALAISATDTLNITTSSVLATAVIYDTTDANVMILDGASSLVFGPGVEPLSLAGHLQDQQGGQLIIGDNGPDTVTTGDTNDALFGGGGADFLNAGDGNNLLQGNTGSDFLESGSGNDTIYGGQDNDQIETGAGTNFAQGNKGDDNIVGGVGADTLLGGQGNDTINGLAIGSDDILDGNLGNDLVFGNGQLLGEDGNDSLNGQGGQATISGGNGDDSITNVSGLADGGAGNDTISLDGVIGDNTITGGDGNDVIDAHFAGADAHININGGNGDDSIVGGFSLDTISGGAGDDTISGGGGPVGGHDVLSGGAGNNLFQISDRAFDAVSGAALDQATITDWGAGDQVHFLFQDPVSPTAAVYTETSAADFAAAIATAAGLHQSSHLNYIAIQVGGDLDLFGFDNHGGGYSVELQGRSLADIDVSMII